MHREGHVGVALLGYAPVGAVTLAVGFDQLALLGGAATVGLAMLPDVDIRLPFVPHRGPTHTVWFALAVGVVLGIVGGLVGASDGALATVGFGTFGFVVGAGAVLSHIAADSLTPAGVTPLAPYRDRHVSYHLTSASNPLANYALLGVGAVAVVAALWLGTLVAAL